MNGYISLDDDRFLQILYDEACGEGNQAERIYKKLCEIADDDRGVKTKMISADRLKIRFGNEMLKVKIGDNDDAENVLSDVLDSIPTVDVQPVQHGKWIEQEDPYINTYECSNCGRWFTLDYGTPKENNYSYCPNCGAKMEGENE